MKTRRPHSGTLEAVCAATPPEEGDVVVVLPFADAAAVSQCADSHRPGRIFLRQPRGGGR